jgi:hypothetical protein
MHGPPQTIDVQVVSGRKPRAWASSVLNVTVCSNAEPRPSLLKKLKSMHIGAAFGRMSSVTLRIAPIGSNAGTVHAASLYVPNMTSDSLIAYPITVL